jgi:hypothetical protein
VIIETAAMIICGHRSSPIRVVGHDHPTGAGRILDQVEVCAA